MEGLEALDNHLFRQIRDFYCQHDVKINDKDTELISRQILRKAEAQEADGTRLLQGEHLDRSRRLDITDRAAEDGKSPYGCSRRCWAHPGAD